MRRSNVPAWQAFGAWLKSIRLSQGLGLRAFARDIKIDPGYLHLIEAGKQPPPSETFLMRIAESLDIPYHTLFAQAGRLPPEVTSQFWSHPAIVPILSTIPGMTLTDAQTFCAQVGKLLPVG